MQFEAPIRDAFGARYLNLTARNAAGFAQLDLKVEREGVSSERAGRHLNLSVDSSGGEDKSPFQSCLSQVLEVIATVP